MREKKERIIDGKMGEQTSSMSSSECGGWDFLCEMFKITKFHGKHISVYLGKR